MDDQPSVKERKILLLHALTGLALTQPKNLSNI